MPTCHECQQSFKGRADARFCSARCRKRAQRKRAESVDVPPKQGPLGFTEMCRLIGDENISFQTLSTDLESASVEHGIGKVTFNTSPAIVVDMLGGEDRNCVGLVMWVTMEKWKEVGALVAAREQKGGECVSLT